MIRPLNYFLPTQTAGPVFQLGGLVANCVHGGLYRRGFLHQYVRRMRVMMHDGTIRVIEEDADLMFWRNSYGLLGFILSLEFDLDYRPKFQAYFKKQEVNWNEEDFWTFLKQEAHADISQEEVPFGQPGDRKTFGLSSSRKRMLIYHKRRCLLDNQATVRHCMDSSSSILTRLVRMVRPR